MLGKAKILFVDDEEHIVNTLKSLCRARYDVYTATNGYAALDIIRNNQIHVIVSDQRMPEMQGIDLLRQVREISPNTIRIMLTGYSDFDAIVGSINEGEIFRYIYKPWRNKDVQNTLDLAADASQVEPVNEFEFSHKLSANGIVVLDDTTQIYTTIHQLFAQEVPVHLARNYEECLDIMAKEPVGVIVSDVLVGRKDVAPLLKLLKREYPWIVTVVITAYHDSNLAVSLINQGQIFRYLGKPVHRGQLRASLEAALRYHARFRHHPALAARHQVENLDVDHDTAMSSAIMSRLKALRSNIMASVLNK